MMDHRTATRFAIGSTGLTVVATCAAAIWLVGIRGAEAQPEAKRTTSRTAQSNRYSSTPRDVSPTTVQQTLPDVRAGGMIPVTAIQIAAPELARVPMTGNVAGLVANDDCINAKRLSVPGSVVGFTTSATRDGAPFCGVDNTAPGIWYSVIGTGNRMTATNCNEFNDYDTRISVYCGDCTNLICVAGNDDNCTAFPGGLEIVDWCSQQGREYLILVHGDLGLTGGFNLNVFSDVKPCANPVDCRQPSACCLQGDCAMVASLADCTRNGGSWFEGADCTQVVCSPVCDVVCDAASTPENEPNCGLPTDSVNGGCFLNEPLFTRIGCGETVCGTAALATSSGFRFPDSDWFEMTLAEPSSVSWKVNAEFDSVIGLVETIPPGTGFCADFTGNLNPSFSSTACAPPDAVVQLNPGTYWFFVGPDSTGPLFPCGAEYIATLSCTPVVLGACCDNGECLGTMTKPECEALGAAWNEGQDCVNFTCPEACCLPTGVCAMDDSLRCREQGGAPQGLGTTCANTICTPPQACCFPTGAPCVDLTPGECETQNGVSGGDGTSCTTTVEACCSPQGGCLLDDPVCCAALGGSPQGAQTACSDVAVPCCLNTGLCEALDPLCCDERGGSPSPTGEQVCRGDSNGNQVDDACESPEACCLRDGTCVPVTPAECQARRGTSQGAGSTCANVNCPPPVVEIDRFEETTALLQLVGGPLGSSPVSAILRGPAEVHVFFDGPIEGDAIDDDGNGRDEVNTEMIAMSLTDGDIKLSVSTLQPSVGQIEELVNNTPGTLDLDPFAPGDADSFFDVFFVIDVGGLVLHNKQPLRIQSIISEKPPIARYNHIIPPGAPVELFDDTGEPTGVFIVKAEHYTGFVEIDTFDVSWGEMELINPLGASELIQVTGQNTVAVFFERGEGQAVDDNGNELDEVETEMLSLNLTGTSSFLGALIVSLNPDMRSTGLIEETANNTPGTLDVSPFSLTGFADSFFDIFFEVDVGGLVLHTRDPKRMRTVIRSKPPAPGDVYENPTRIPLYNANGELSGYSIGSARHEPNPGEACCLTDGTCLQSDLANCETLGGTPQGIGSTCNGVTCPLLGACCSAGECLGTLGQDECLAAGGRWFVGEDCASFSCPPCQKPAPPGDDCWVTPCGSTRFDFAQQPIPADFFGPGSDPFAGMVQLGGVGGVDTVISRLSDMCFEGTLPVTSETPVEIIRLNLVSCRPITVTYGGEQFPELWNVRPFLDGQQQQGLLTATKTDPGGGAFDSDLPVQIGFEFTGPMGSLTLSPVPLQLLRVAGAAWSQIPPAKTVCDSNGFYPGLPPDGATCCEPTCHEGSEPGHVHCVYPPECPPCPQLEACCFADRTCVDVTVDECLARDGYPQGINTTCANRKCPAPPFIERDVFEDTTALVQLVGGPLGATPVSFVLRGPAEAHVFFDGSVEGDSDDDDGNGREEVRTELVSLDLTNGTVRLSLQPGRRSLGLIEELVNNTLGRLDLDPFAPGDAESFFDIFFQVEIDGRVMHNNQPLRIQSIIREKPPTARYLHAIPPTNPIALFDESGQPTGVFLVKAEHFTGTVEVDSFELSLGEFEITDASGNTSILAVTGPAVVHVFFEGAEGDADDDTGDGLEEVQTEMVSLDLTGADPGLGVVRVTLNPALRSTGLIEEDVNNTPGTLDLPPFTVGGSASSYFDLFLQVEVQGMVLHTIVPKRMSSRITNKPPAPADFYEGLVDIKLYDQKGGATGFMIGASRHRPRPPVEVDSFDLSLGEFEISGPFGTTVLPVTGPAVVHVFFEGAAEGDASDDDGDGLEEVRTEMVSLDLTGADPGLGVVRVTLNPSIPSMGLIKENVNNTPGTLDLPPFAVGGTASSYFDLFLQVQVQGMTLHTIVPKRMSSTITNKPPAPADFYEGLVDIELYDENGQASGIVIGASRHRPRPPVEVDSFDFTLGQFEISGPFGTKILSVTGPAVVHVFFEGNAEGDAGDDDGDGLEEVRTEMVSLDLTGSDPDLGFVNVAVNPDIPSMGLIEEDVNNTAGTLDLPPFTPNGSASSYFDLFLQVTVQGMTLHTKVPKRMSSRITYKPPAPGDFYEALVPIELFDQNDNPTGIVIGASRHVPQPSLACCLPEGQCETMPGSRCLERGGVPLDPGSACEGDTDGNGVDDACEDASCEDCGPGAHWVDRCASSTDSMPSAAKIGIDVNLDCIPDTNLVLRGPASVRRSFPRDDSRQYPGLRAVDGHLDVLDTEIVSMSLTGAGVTMIAGAWSNSVAPLQTSMGAIAEQSGDDAQADSFFDVFFEVSLGGGALAYNQSPLRVAARIDCIPPDTTYIHPVGCIPLYDSPIVGQGRIVANLVTADHSTFPACGDPAAGDCFAVADTPYCDDGECCETVCATDPFCCDDNGRWDPICVELAKELCPKVPEACCLPDGRCLDVTPEACRQRDGSPGSPGSACRGDCNRDGVDDACAVPGDMDGDGDVDLNDWKLFRQCLRGPSVPVASICSRADFNCDGTVDMGDVRMFQNGYGR